MVRPTKPQGVAELAACKTSVAEYVSTHGTNKPANEITAGCTTTATQYVARLSFDGVDTIKVVTQATGAKPAECSLMLQANTASLPEITTWTGKSGACDFKYVPSNFRG